MKIFSNWAGCAEHIKIYRDKNAVSNGKVGKISIMSNNSMIFKLNNKEDFPNVRK